MSSPGLSEGRIKIVRAHGAAIDALSQCVHCCLTAERAELRTTPAVAFARNALKVDIVREWHSARMHLEHLHPARLIRWRHLDDLIEAARSEQCGV